MRLLSKQLFFALATVLAPAALPATAAIYPAGDAFAEQEDNPGVAVWGAYAGAFDNVSNADNIVEDTADKTAGNASIKYQNMYAGDGVLRPALIFSPAHDFTPFAGGDFSFDLKISDITGFDYLTIILQSTGGGEAYYGTPQTAVADWQTYTIPWPENGDFSGGVWAVYGFNPAAIERVTFAFKFNDPIGQDPIRRDIGFDNVRMEYVPEPAMVSLLGLSGVVFLRRARHAVC